MQPLLMRSYPALILILVLAALNCACTEPEATAAPVYRLVTDKSFEDVVFDLKFAISERNFRITGSNKIGKGLRERGYERYPDLEVIHFCSLERAREVLDLDPDYIAQMPCRIAVHEQGDKVIINAILLPENHSDARINEFAGEMNKLIRDIVAFAVEEY